jgi:hypothetical protein
MCLSLLSLIFGAAIYTTDNRQKKPEAKSAVDDDNGKLSWKSTAEPDAKSEDWNYLVTIQNEKQDKRCRVNWSFTRHPSWKGTIDPGQARNVFDHSCDVPPTDVKGEIKYNGGGPGEGKAATNGWFPKTDAAASAPTHSRTTATLSFESDKTLVDVRATATSSVSEKDGDYYIIYTLKMDIPKDIKLKFYRLRWTAVNDARISELFTDVVDPKTHILKLDPLRSEKVIHKVIHLRKDENKKVVLNSGSIAIEYENGESLAQAWLPIIVPPKDE